MAMKKPLKVIKTFFCDDLFTSNLNLADSKVRKLTSPILQGCKTERFKGNHLASTGVVFINMFLSGKCWPTKKMPESDIIFKFLGP